LEILLQIADLCVVAVGGAIDLAQFASPQQRNGIADVGIIRHAALKAPLAPDFARQVESSDPPTLAACGRAGVFAHFGDETDESAPWPSRRRRTFRPSPARRTSVTSIRSPHCSR
jgi:hypothetical protein